MNKIIRLILCFIFILSSLLSVVACDALEHGPITENQLLDGKTPKALYGNSVNKYKNHKDEGYPYAVNIVWTYADNPSLTTTIDLTWDADNYDYTVVDTDENSSISESVVYCDGTMYYTSGSEEKYFYDTDPNSAEIYLDDFSRLKYIHAAFPDNLPESWLDELKFIPDGEDCYKIEIDIDHSKGKKHPKYPDFFKDGAKYKVYFTKEGILHHLEAVDVAVDGQTCTLVISFSWNESLTVNAPDDADSHQYRGHFDPHLGEPGDDFREDNPDDIHPDDDIHDDHEHQSGDAVYERVTEPTCTEDGCQYEIYYCTVEGCGIELERSLKSIPAIGHTYINAACSRCQSGQVFENCVIFTLSEDKTYYILSSIGSYTGENIIVPSTYKGLPVKEIGVGAFYECHTVKSITIPESVCRINASAFSNCYNLMSINIPESVTEICFGVFAYCENLPEIIIPEGVKSIGEYAFWACRGLTSLTVPDGVTDLPYYCFAECWKLESIVIPSSVKSVDYGAFTDCNKLNNVCYEGTLDEWRLVSVDNSDGYNKCLTRPIAYYSDTAPTELGRFWHWVDGAPMLWPEQTVSPSHEHISAGTVIENKTDATCIAIGHMDEVSYCYICGEEIARSVITLVMKDHNFVNGYCSYCSQSEADVHVHTPDLPITLNNVDPTCTEDGHYYEVIYCSDINCRATLDETLVIVESLGHNYVNGTCTRCGKADPNYIPTTSEGLEFALSSDGTYYILIGIGTCTDSEIVVPNTHNGLPVAEVGEHAFQFNNDIVKLVLCSNMRLLNKYCFSNCTSLENVVFNNGLITISQDSFSGCSSLVKVFIPDSVTYIGQYAFEYCESVTDLCIGKGVEFIDYFAFFGCSALTELTIPGNVKTIRADAFNRCAELETVLIEKGVEIIDCGFHTDFKLKAIYYGGSEKDWASVEYVKNSEVIANAGIYFYSEAEPTTEGRFWHYVNGVPTIWEVENEPVYSEGLEFILAPYGENHCYVSGIGSCTDSRIVIPYSSPDGQMVIGIASAAFQNCTQITSVTTHEYVGYIGASAFEGCTNLTEVHLGIIDTWCYTDGFTSHEEMADPTSAAYALKTYLSKYELYSA